MPCQQKLGFKGVIVTDDLADKPSGNLRKINMPARKSSPSAGNDLTMSENDAGTLRLSKHKRQTNFSKADQSSRCWRILKLKKNWLVEINKVEAFCPDFYRQNWASVSVSEHGYDCSVFLMLSIFTGRSDHEINVRLG